MLRAAITMEVGYVILVLEIIAEVTLLTFQIQVWKRIGKAETTAEARFQSILKRYDAVKAEAKAEAEARIAAAQAQVNEITATLDKRAAELEEKARSMEMARRGALGHEAKAQKAEVAAVIEAEFSASAGPEVVAFIKEQFPDVWQSAIDHPRIAARILQPVVNVINGRRAAQATVQPSRIPYE